MLRVIFHDDPATNQKLQKWVSILSILGMLGAGLIWFSPIADSWNTTHAEAKEMDTQTMNEHNKAIEAVPYAMQSDVNHAVNLMVEEQITDAEEDIKGLEDKEDLTGDLTAQERRKLLRMRNARDKYPNKYLNEADADHIHEGQEQ